MRSEIAGFANHSIARDDGGNDLAQGSRERVIPGADDADHSERLVGQAARFSFGSEAVMRDALGLQHALAIFRKVRGGIDSHENIREQSFDARLARFRNDGVSELVSARHDAVTEVAKPLATCADRKRHPSGLRSTRSRDEVWQRGRSRFLKVSESLATGRIYGR